MSAVTVDTEYDVGTSSRMRGHPTPAAPPLMVVRGLTKSYRRGPVEIPVLRGVDMAIASGEFIAIVGQSGSGKSTLLHLLGALDIPDHGEIFYEGNRVDNLPARGRDMLRNRHFGMVFQFYHLLPELNALENVLLPHWIRCSPWTYWANRRELKRKGMELLESVGLSHRASHRPSQLSGGEMQRVAIARTMMSEPRILFADEPTGNLDRGAGEGILRLLCDLKRNLGITIVMVTHDLSIAEQAERTIRLVEGKME